MQKRNIALIAGWSYVVIFFAAIFANFFALESLATHPIETLEGSQLVVRLGIMAFLVTAVFDVIVAWALQILGSKNQLSLLSTLFRVLHAGIMAVAVFALVEALPLTDAQQILGLVDRFNIIWLLGLFFFGFHLILLARIITMPKWIATAITLAGIAYIVDTSAHFVLPNYDAYADVFLAMVAVPSILGEMTFAIWLLAKGEKK